MNHMMSFSGSGGKRLGAPVIYRLCLRRHHPYPTNHRTGQEAFAVWLPPYAPAPAVHCTVAYRVYPVL